MTQTTPGFAQMLKAVETLCREIQNGCPGYSDEELQEIQDLLLSLVEPTGDQKSSPWLDIEEIKRQRRPPSEVADSAPPNELAAFYRQILGETTKIYFKDLYFKP